MSSPPAVSGSPGCVWPAKVRKCGYLRKQRHGHKRFFVLMEGGGGCPARLEYYDSEKKWRSRSSARRVVSLGCCLSINKRADSKHRYLVALYTREEYLAVAADSEVEQHSWFTALSDLLPQVSGPSTPPPYTDPSDYCPLPSALYKQVWQVHLKPKGLGQARNLSGAYMLCLSSHTMALVKLNYQLPSVSLQLMSIRRCGHSDNLFFIEVGRSASTGPGELWMQVDDSVVAQHIHETILEAMKEVGEFRPRSKSQSSGSHPISVPGRRHLAHLPPSQAGLPHRSCLAPPASHRGKSRARTASEGDRPDCASGSPIISPGRARTHCSRPSTMARPPRAGQPNQPMSLSHSPLSATSPVSLSSSSGHGSVSDTPARPASASQSVSGSPSDGGFISLDEYGSSPGDVRQYTGYRSNTPESLTCTPPVRQCTELHGYTLMERLACCHPASPDKSYRRRTYSLTTPCPQRADSQLSSISLDDYTLMKATSTGDSARLSSPVSPSVAYSPYPEDYCGIQVGSRENSGRSNLGDDGYMPMTHGVTGDPRKNDDDYMPMSPKSVSAPKQIINPRSHSQVNVGGYKNTSPAECYSPDSSQYKIMWCGAKLSVDSSDGKFARDQYMDMSPVDRCASVTPPDCFFPVSEELPRSSDPFYGSPQPNKPHSQKDDHYMLMRLPHAVILEEPALDAKCNAPPSVGNHAVHSPAGQGGLGGFAHRGRAVRPPRLSLEKLQANAPSSANDPASLPQPKSPGEYVSIDFGSRFLHIAPYVPEKSHSTFANAQRGLAGSDYMNVHLNSELPKNGFDAVTGSRVSCPCRDLPADVCLKSGREDEAEYTEMAFISATTPPLPVLSKHESAQLDSPASGMKRLSLIDHLPGVDVFVLPSLAPDPNRGAKVIRANPQGRRRHSSETFSSTTTVTPVSPSFAHDPKRHSSASFENVSLRKNEESEGVQGSPICRKTSAGIQSGLNYVALGLGNDNFFTCEKVAECQRTPQRKGNVNFTDDGAYTTLGFVSKNFDQTAAVED